MSRLIRLTFVAEGVSANAELLDAAAPRTSDAVWNALPVSGMSHHAVYSGSEGVLLLPDVLRVAPENATSDVSEGDVAFTWFAAGSAHGVTEDFAEICWFYAEDARPSMHGGPVPVSVFARIVGDARAFYAVCRRMRREGIKPLAVERVRPPSPGPVGGIMHCLVHRDPRFCSAEPTIAVTADDEVVVAFVQHPPHAGEDHADPRALPVLVRSSDGGRTWSPRPEPVCGYALFGARSIVLRASSGGALLASIDLPTYAATDDEPGWRTSPGQTVAAQSLDGGRTWTFCGPDDGLAGDEDASAAAVRAEGRELSRITCAFPGSDEFVIRDFGLANMGSPSHAVLGDGRFVCVYQGSDGGPGCLPGHGVCGIHASSFALTGERSGR